MSANALGPTLAGGMQPIVKDGFELLYLPDVNNDSLQREGKAPVFYWLPNYVRMARKGGREDGDFMFNLIRFAGVQSADTTVGATGDREVAGGVLTFTVTGAPPDRVLTESQQKISEQWNGSRDHFWGIRARQAPVFRPAIITSNVTTISNVSPIAGGIPAAGPGPGGGNRSADGRMVRVFGTPPLRELPRTVPESRDLSGESNLNPWFWNMQGQGNGSIDPAGQNAYSALLGAYPTAILWQAFHGTASPVVVIQALKLKVWSPVVSISIRGRWRRVFEHFSAALHAHYLWASADIKAEINKMRINGSIEVDVKVDQTLPNADKIAEQIDKRSDLVFEKFMEQAKQVIFEPPQPNVQAAQASSGGGPWGVSLALKWRRDETDLNLNYSETRQFAYLQEHTISSSLEGMYDEMKRDPTSERKYFLSVFLDDWPRKLARIVKPVVAWPKPEQNWAGQPVAFVSAQIGYPNTQGELMWTGHTFQKSDPADASWKIGITQKTLADVANPPGNWAPDKTFVKRKIHLLEPPDAAENPFVRVQIDRNVIDLDPEPNGSVLNDVTLEARADAAGKVAVGPTFLGAELENSKQTVEVTFELTDSKGQPLGREQARFTWNFSDQEKPRFWTVFTGDPTILPFFRYKVRVIVKGSIFSKGKEWEGPWVATSGNGPFTVRVPTLDDPGVVPRDVPLFLTGAAREAPPAPTPPTPAVAVEPVPTGGLTARGWPVTAGTATRDTGAACASGHRSKEGDGAAELEVVGWRQGD